MIKKFVKWLNKPTRRVYPLDAEGDDYRDPMGAALAVGILLIGLGGILIVAVWH